MKNLFAILFVLLGLFIFHYSKESIYPQGDDLWHLEGSDRLLPFPKTHLMNGSRVIDHYVTYHAFNFFEMVYTQIMGPPVYDKFFEMFQYFNSCTYTIIFLLFLLAILSELKKPSGLSVLFFMASVVVLTSQMPYFNMTDLFAYQLTGLITVVFLVKTFPVKDILGESTALKVTNISSSRFVFLSFMAYLTSIGMETFIALSWVYIISAYSIHLVKNLIEGHKLTKLITIEWANERGRALILIQFFLYSIWSTIAVLTSGREPMLIREAKNLDKIKPFEILQSIVHSDFGIFSAVVFFSHALLMLSKHKMKPHPSSLKVSLKVSTVATDVRYLFIFLVMLFIGYIGIVWMQSWLTNVNYFVYKFTMPLCMIMLIVLGGTLSGEVISKINTIILVTLMSALLYRDLLAFKQGCELRSVMANDLKYAFTEASKISPNGLIPVHFSLPTHYNDGYPLLPGRNARPWYRRGYRKILNKYYGANFGFSSPQFYEEKQDLPVRQKAAEY